MPLLPLRPRGETNQSYRRNSELSYLTPPTSPHSSPSIPSSHFLLPPSLMKPNASILGSNLLVFGFDTNLIRFRIFYRTLLRNLTEEGEDEDEEEKTDWKEICVGRSSWKERVCRGLVWKNSLVILSSNDKLSKEVNFLDFSSSKVRFRY